jgi:hypothetical protein
MRLCDHYAAGSMGEYTDGQFHEVVRTAENQAWEAGYAAGMGQGQGGEVLSKLLAYLDKSDDDEVGLFLSQLKAGAGKG